MFNVYNSIIDEVLDNRPNKPKISLSWEEFLVCKERGTKMNEKYKYSSTEYQRGLIANTFLYGLLGELAFTKVYHCRLPDFNVYNHADIGYDTVLNGKTIDIKGNFTHNNLLVCVGRRYGNIKPLTSDIYFATRIYLNLLMKTIDVYLLGGSTKEYVNSQDSVRGKGENINKVVEYRHLRSIEELI